MRLAEVKVEEVSRRLGHSRTSVTMDVYVDVFREADKQVTAGLYAILSNSRSRDVAAFSLPRPDEATVREIASERGNGDYLQSYRVEVRGVEPLTSAVRRQRSTTELHPRAPQG
jgi:hypothetical protein